jgi:hypothetical protein
MYAQSRRDPHHTSAIGRLCHRNCVNGARLLLALNGLAGQYLGYTSRQSWGRNSAMRQPTIRLLSGACSDLMAEREGFEPPVPLRVRLISSQVHSTGLCHLSALFSITYACNFLRILCNVSKIVSRL